MTDIQGNDRICLQQPNSEFTKFYLEKLYISCLSEKYFYDNKELFSHGIRQEDKLMRFESKELWQEWSSLEYAPRDQFEAWCTALNDSHLKWSLDSSLSHSITARSKCAI